MWLGRNFYWMRAFSVLEWGDSESSGENGNFY
jgi:hypothetical protein